MNAMKLAYRLVPPLLALSLVTNLAVLINPLFMMQVLDRVIPSGNQNTLALLGLLALAALALQAAIELTRDLSLKRLANWVERSAMELALEPGRDDPQTLINKVGSVAQFLRGPQAAIVLSVPWIPVLAFVLFLLHPLFVVLLLCLVLAFVANRTFTNILERPSQSLAMWHAHKEQECLSLAAQAAKNGETATISNNLRQRFVTHQTAKLETMGSTYRLSVTMDALSGLFRQGAQILTLALGAFLVTEQALSAGGMIAASILLAKTYGTTEAAIGQFTTIRAVFDDYRGLSELEKATARISTDIPDLSGTLKAENLVFPRGNGARPRLDRVAVELRSGECLAIVGPAGSGKTTLLKALAGINLAPIGSVYYDQSEIRGLSDTTLFRVTGYLPQQAALLPGTIAENIACFSPGGTDEQIIEAAKSAGVHGLISALHDSYDTNLESDPHILSAGQKQRIALARAIFSNPRYLFLDEPNALLDAEGERALNQILNRLKARGTTIVIVLHRSGLMGLADKVMRLEAGRCIDLGPRSDVLARMTSGRRQIIIPRLISSMQDLSDWISSQFNRPEDTGLSHTAELVACEMFTAICEASGQDSAEKVTVHFMFRDNYQCELSMVEHGASKTDATLIKVKQVLSRSPGSADIFTPEEQAIANLVLLGDSVEISSVEHKTILRVSVSDQSNQMVHKMARAG